MTRWHTCPSCGERAGSFLDAFTHCDWNSPIDDPEDDE